MNTERDDRLVWKAGPTMNTPVCPVHDTRIHDELEGCNHCKADAELEAAEHAEEEEGQ